MKIIKNQIFYIVPIIILAFLYYIFGEFSFYLLPKDKIVTISIFFPEGIALAFAIIYGYRVVLGIFIGQLILSLLNQVDLLPSFEIAVINSLEAILAIYLFEEFNISKKLETLKDFAKLVGLIVFILQPFSATISNIALIVYSQTSENTLIFNIFCWWFGNLMAQILITPFILIMYYKIKEIKILPFISYGIVYGIYMYMLIIYLQVNNYYVLFLMSMLILAFVSCVKDLIYGLFLNVVLSLIILYSIHIHSGIFVYSAIIDNTVKYSIFILLHITIVWILNMKFKDKCVKLLEG